MTKTLPNSTTLPNRFDRFFLVRDRTRSGLNYRLGVLVRWSVTRRRAVPSLLSCSTSLPCGQSAITGVVGDRLKTTYLIVKTETDEMRQNADTVFCRIPSCHVMVLVGLSGY